MPAFRENVVKEMARVCRAILVGFHAEALPEEGFPFCRQCSAPGKANCPILSVRPVAVMRQLLIVADKAEELPLGRRFGPVRLPGDIGTGVTLGQVRTPARDESARCLAGVKSGQVKIVIEQLMDGVGETAGNSCFSRSTARNRGLKSIRV